MYIPKEISYRKLLPAEIDSIAQVNPTVFIQRALRDIGGKKEYITINWLEEGFPNGYEAHYHALKHTFDTGGFAYGVFHGDKLTGFISVNNEFFGTELKYLLLDQLFITTAYMNHGFGKQLFKLAAAHAKEAGADKLYICAGSSEATLKFYYKLGCKEAVEINQSLYEADPRDVQLEYVL